jgi:hypothetical protein
LFRISIFLKHLQFRRYFYPLAVLSISSIHLKSQNISNLGMQRLNLREAQLVGTSSNASSMTNGLLSLSKVDSALQNSLIFHKKNINQDLLPGNLYFYNLSLEYINNTSRPFGWGNGSMIAAKGGQSRISSGLFYKTKLFEVNLQPEWVRAANKPYKTTAIYGFNTNKIYNKFFMGQSYAQLNMGPLATGFSNENLWWGPGQSSALIFSNNAPGFGHLHFSTRRPIRTPVFDLEWQFIAGGLDQDSLLNTEIRFQKPGQFDSKWRYMNGMILSLQPKIIPGLYIGFSRVMQFYSPTLKNKTSFFERYLPSVTEFFKKKINTQADALNQDDSRDQQATVFMRMVFPKEKFEFYFEYGLNDFKDNTRDLVQDAQHAGAYIVGFKKMVDKGDKKFISIAGELVQMAQSPVYLVRNAGNWYEHGRMVQGFTHMNQILGAGSGMGNNVQMVHIEKVEKENRLGFKFQRIQNDPRQLSATVATQWLSPIKWTDFSLGPTFSIHKSKFSIQGEAQFVNSKNYGWSKERLSNFYSSLNFIYHW